MPSIPNIDIDPPKYGPGDWSSQIYKMLTDLPKSYYGGQKEEFERGQRERTERLQKLQDPILEAQTRETLKEYNDPNQPPRYDYGDGGTSSEVPTSTRLARNTGGGANEGGAVPGNLRTGETPPGVAPDVTPTGTNRGPLNVRQIAINMGVDPNAPGLQEHFGNIDARISPQKAREAYNKIKAGMFGPADEEAPEEPGAAAGAPPETAPGLTTAALRGAAAGREPVGGYMPGVGPPPQGAAPGPQVAQAPGQPPNLATPLRPFVQQPPAPALPSGAPALVPQPVIDKMRNTVTDLRRRAGNLLPGPKQNDYLSRAKDLEEVAKKAQEARDKVAADIDPYKVAKEREDKILDGDIKEGQKEHKILQSRAEAADDANQALAVMRTKMSDPSFFAGAGHEIVQQTKEWITTLGGNPKAADTMQEFKKVAIDQLNKQIRTMSESGFTRIQLQEIRNMKEALLNLGVGPGANRYIMETLSRAHQLEMKLGDFSNRYVQQHRFLDHNWPAAKREFLARPENRLFTDQERQHPEMIAPPYYPGAFAGDVTKTKQFINNQKLKGDDPVAVDDYSRPVGPDGVRPRKIVHASDILERYGK
jgi:hypothetical protein